MTFAQAELVELSARTRLWRRSLEREAGEARAAALRGKELMADIADSKSRVEHLIKAGSVLTRIGEDKQHAAQEQIEMLVTRGLQVIFDSDTSFHVVQSVKAGRPQVDFLIRSTMDGKVVETSVMDSRGGGVASVVGFLLRLVVLLLGRKQGALLVLDETFGMVSEDYEPRVAEFLRELVDKTGVQVLLITHSTAFDDVADKRYRFAQTNGATAVKEL